MGTDAKPTWLLRVEMQHAVFGIIVAADGSVMEAAPIAKWSVGKRGREVVRYFRERGATVTVHGGK
ncbi:MAG: hypothetical protein WC683_03005 [bacterium]